MRADAAAEFTEAQQEPDIEVFPENWDALLTFLACNTQWRFTQHSISGLDYPAVESVMRMRRVPARERAALLDKIRILESAALKELNRKR